MKSIGNKVLTVIIAVVLLSITTVILSDLQKETPEGWHYDDYREIPGATSADGSLELVTVDSIQYVHAKDLGIGHYTVNGSTEKVTVLKSDLDLFLMTGQSNACHCITYKSQITNVPPMGTAYYYGSADSYSELDSTATFHPMRLSTGVLAVGDKAPVFCSDYYNITGHKTYFVCGAIGGQNIFTFDPENGSTWEYMKTTVNNAINAVNSSYFNIHVKGYMWIQGEADENTSITSYETAFMKMHKAILAGDLGVKFDHCFISKIRGDGNAAKAQIELAAEYPDTITLSTTAADSFTIENGTMHTDDLHYLQLGDDIIGADLAESVGSYYNAERVADIPVWQIINVIPLILAAVLLAGIVGSYFIKKKYF